MAGPASIIGAEAIRVARLTADGTPDYNNPLGGFMLCGGISTFQHTVVQETGDDIFVKDARGRPCVVKKQDDLIKRVEFTLTLCRDDYRLAEILCGGDVSVIGDGQKVVGAAINVAAGCGTSTGKSAVSLELWSQQWDCDVPLVDKPYMRSVLGKCKIVPDGYTRQNGASLPVYKGFSMPNANFGDGPFGDLDLLVGHTGWAMVDIDNDVVPTCVSPLSYIAIPGSAS